MVVIVSNCYPCSLSVLLIFAFLSSTVSWDDNSAPKRTRIRTAITRHWKNEFTEVKERYSSGSIHHFLQNEGS